MKTYFVYFETSDYAGRLLWKANSVFESKLFSLEHFIAKIKSDYPEVQSVLITFITIL